MALAARVLRVLRRESGSRVLIDTGNGDDRNVDEARRADIDPICLADTLRRAGVAPDAIADLALTHVHQADTTDSANAGTHGHTRCVRRLARRYMLVACSSGMRATAIGKSRLPDVARDGTLVVPRTDPTVGAFRVRRVRDRSEVVQGTDDFTSCTRISSSPPGSRIYALRDHEMSVVMDQHVDETRVRARVLFVDDEVQMTTAIRRALSREPFEVIAANSVTEAFALFEENDFDIIVSDELMPEMSGSEFLARIRHEHPFTVRILLTGRASLDTAIHAVNRAGVFRFLQKPCSVHDLIDSLHDAVEHRMARVLQPPTILPPPDPAVIELQSRYERAVHGLWVAVQPVVSVTQRAVYAYECLARTREPSVPHGGAFVELAERVGRMQHLDRSIRVSVAQVLEQTNDALTVLVNLHPSSLDDPDLLSPAAPLSRHAHHVVLELTERASLHDLNAVREKVTALRALGYRIAVDDLGAGYAGLTSLALLHPEIVKLDMELVRGVHLTSTKAKLVAAVITLCRELGAEVIAEGVETDEEYEALRALGCSLLQGYYFARPGEPFPNVRWP